MSRDTMSILRRRSRWVALGALAGLAAGVVFTFFGGNGEPSTRYYKATATIAAATGGQTTARPGLGPALPAGTGAQRISDALQFAQSGAFYDQVAASNQLSKHVASEYFSSERGTKTPYPTVDVTALATNPDTAKRRADGAAKVIIDEVNQSRQPPSSRDREQAKAQLADLRAQYQDVIGRIAQNPANAPELRQQAQNLSDRISSLESTLQATSDDEANDPLELFRPASAIQINSRGYNYRRTQNANAQDSLPKPKKDDGADFDETDLSPGAWPPPKPLRIPLGIGAGLLSGLILAFSIEVLDDRIRWREDVEGATGLPVITEVPRLGRDQMTRQALCVSDDSTEMMLAAERYRSARTDLRFLLEGVEGGQAAPVVLVTSPGPGEGKSTTSANLAAVLAEGDLRVLAVDGDFRRPALGKLLKPIPNLVDPSGPSETAVTGLEFIGVSATGVRPEADIEHVKTIVDRFQNDYDLVVVDTPPILTTNDAADMLGIADLVVLVLRSGKTRQRPTMMAAELFERYGSEVAGVILNACDRQQMDAYHGYGYGYGYTRRAERNRG